MLPQTYFRKSRFCVILTILVPAALCALDPLIHDSEPGLSYLGEGRIKMGRMKRKTQGRGDEEEWWL